MASYIIGKLNLNEELLKKDLATIAKFSSYSVRV